MHRLFALVGVCACVSAPVRADDRPLLQRIAERGSTAPGPVREHSAARAGYPLNVSRFAVPSVTRHDHGGYIGGGSVRNNNLLARGPGSALGVPQELGTYGTDYGGVRAHLGRVFLAPSADPSTGKPIQKLYNADGPRVVDVLALRPLRKAVLERREDMQYGHGKSGSGAGTGHGGEAGHASEGGGDAKGGGH